MVNISVGIMLSVPPYRAFMKLKYWLFVVVIVVVVKNCKAGVQVFDFFTALCRQYPATYRITPILYPSSVTKVLGGSDVVSRATMISNMFLSKDITNLALTYDYSLTI